MNQSNNRLVAWSRLFIVCVAISATLVWGQAAAMAHFVAPIYPPLARQAMISGRVVFTLNVAADGKILGIKEEASSHTLLAQSAKNAVRQWLFQETVKPRSVIATVHFGFSGETCETNPVTIVKADFAASTVRVYVTTDGVSTVRP